MIFLFRKLNCIVCKNLDINENSYSKCIKYINTNITHSHTTLQECLQSKYITISPY